MGPGTRQDERDMILMIDIPSSLLLSLQLLIVKKKRGQATFPCGEVRSS